MAWRLLSREVRTPATLCILAALVMSYGWGYRGIVGHEGGAMVPGAMLGMAICLGSNRADWQRRAAVAGLFGAVGWAWDGTLSYMEQTFYTLSGSFWDVLYGYAMLFFLGALWAGIGGAVLGLAFTLPRSHLSRFVGPFVAICSVFLATYLSFFFMPAARESYERFTAERFHDSDWMPATTVIVVCGVYALVRKREREEAFLFLACGVAWWIGYLGFTKFGGLVLGPPYRSEGWGGVVGILALLIAYLSRQRNRAALMLSLYGIVGGGFAFSLAVFVRHPIRVSWGPFADWDQKMQWKIAEESFGLFMGLAIALGILRLMRGGLAPAAEDQPPKPLDVFAVFVMLVALMWVNLRRAPMGWIERYHFLPEQPVVGIMPWLWLTIGGVVLSTLAVYALYLYWNDVLSIAPSTPYGKGALVLIILVWVTVVEAFVQDFPAAHGGDFPLVDASFILLASIVTALLLSQSGDAPRADAETESVPPSDARWNVGWRYGLVWLCVPIVLVTITEASIAMQNGPAQGSRQRFGPNAYWRQITQIVGTWELGGATNEVDGSITTPPIDAPTRLEFKQDRTILVTRADGKQELDAHTWEHRDSVVWLQWYARKQENPQRASLPMTLKGNRLYIPWPPNPSSKTYAVYGKGNSLPKM